MPPITRLAIAVAVFAATAANVQAAERYERKSWRRVKTYDMAALQKVDPLPMRQIVAVRFGYRHPDIRHLKPNWFYSSIWSVTRDGNKAEFSHIPVMVAKADLEAFRELPTNPESARNFTVYGQVLQDSEAGFLFLRLIGTKLKQERRTVRVSW